MDTAARIKALRLESQLTQRQLADRVDVEPITVSRWERGKAVPSDLNRVLLARAFNVHPNDLLPTEKAA